MGEADRSSCGGHRWVVQPTLAWNLLIEEGGQRQII
jgi:hypothetical protein